jgi:ABC-type branched-subunit amino acid transport system substrate-binding protein
MSEPTALDPRIGTEFLGYRIEALVGRGGMGVVYRAYDLRLKRNVALKLVAPEYAEDSQFRERFLTETELAASLEHPDVVPIYDAGEVDGQLYLAMRFVEGTDLKRRLVAEGSLPPRRALEIVSHVADALDAAHTQGLVHRDVKPSNVLLDEREHPYLADFGLTRRLDDPGSPTAGLSVGTPAYVAPEQIRGDPVDGRADQYALACMLAECLTGDPPFRRQSEVAMLYAHLEDDPLPSGSPLDPVVAKALAKDPASRYPTCAALVQAAREALGITEPRARRWPFLAAAIVLAVAVAALAAILLTRDGGTRAPEAAGRLIRIDPHGRVETTIAVGTEPSALALRAGKVWVADRVEKTLSRLDIESGEVELEAPAPGTPTDVAVRGPSVVVTHGPSEAGVVLFNAGTGAQEDSFTLSEGVFAFGSPRTAVQGDDVWIATGGRRVGRLSRVSGRIEGATMMPRDPDEADAFISALAVEGDTVWVIGDPNQPELWRLDRDTGQLDATLQLPAAPTDVVAAYGAVWVSSHLDDVVLRVDPAANRVTDTITVGRGAGALATGAGFVWVTNELDETISRIDPDSLATDTISVEGSPTGVTADAEAVWVTTRPAPADAPEDAIAIGVIASCEGPFGSFGELSFAGAELPLVLRGATTANGKPSAGVVGASVAGKDVALYLECGDDTAITALGKARRLVEDVGVDILIGSTQASEAFAIRDYARAQSQATFLGGTAYPQALTLHDPSTTYFRFTPDGAQWMAGLGAYAYHELGWRRAVTIGDDWLGGYVASAGFAAEFCSLGGRIVKSIWAPLGTQDYTGSIAQVPRNGVDGFLMAGLPSMSQAFIEGLPRLQKRPAAQMVGTVFFWSLVDAGMPVGDVMSAEALGAEPGNSRYLSEFRRVFPDLGPFAWDIWPVYFYVPMEAALQALEVVNGDLSDGQARFRAALARTEIDAPNGHIRLDERRQAIAPNYLVKYRKPESGASPVVHNVKRIASSEQTFNGYFSPDDPPLGRDTIECKRGNPPPWARR